MLNTMMENENTSFLKFRSLSCDHVHSMGSCSQQRDRNISKTCVFSFHHSIQHDEASGYNFYNEVNCPN